MTDTEAKSAKQCKDKDCKDDETKELTEPEDGKMSRGVRQETELDHSKLRELFVYDEMGNKICFGDIYKHQKTIIIFVRHFLDFITKEYVEDLALIPLEYLQRAGVRLVVIGPSPYKFIKSFKDLTKYQHTLYCDPDREVYKALGLKEKNEYGPLQKSKHVKSGVISGVLTSMWRAMQVQEYQGNPKQQGGSFILGPGEEVHYTHLDQRNTDHVNINDLLTEAGVQTVSFPNDQRVITV